MTNHRADRRFERAEHNNDTLQSALQLAQLSGDTRQQLQVQMHMAAGLGAYDFPTANLNSLVNITPIPFEQWLGIAWAGQL